MDKLITVLPAFLVVLMMSGCTSDKEPAAQKLDDVTAVMRAVASDAAKYAPVQYAEADRQRAELQFSYDQKDYAAVVRSAPAVLVALDRVSAEVVRQRDAEKNSTGGEWVVLRRKVPRLLTTLKTRLAAISAGTEPAAGVDVGASQATVADAAAQWDVARSAYMEGNGSEAIAVAREAKLALDAEADVLNVADPEASP